MELPSIWRYIARELRLTRPHSSNADPEIYKQLHCSHRVLSLPLLLPLLLHTSDRAQEVCTTRRATISPLMDPQRPINRTLPAEDLYSLPISGSGHTGLRLTDLPRPHQLWIYSRWPTPTSDKPQPLARNAGFLTSQGSE